MAFAKTVVFALIASVASIAINCVVLATLPDYAGIELYVKMAKVGTIMTIISNVLQFVPLIFARSVRTFRLTAVVTSLNFCATSIGYIFAVVSYYENTTPEIQQKFEQDYPLAYSAGHALIGAGPVCMGLIFVALLSLRAHSQ